MAPYFNVLGIDLYTILICIGILVAIVLFRVFCDKKKLPPRVFNFFIILIAVAIGVGFLLATLIQSFYNFLESGVWKWEGMTFLGGLIGGVVCFFALYFLLGHFLFKEKEHIQWMDKFVCCAIPCIVLAHAFGRMGCLCAGCCYGKQSNSFGLPMLIDGVWERRVPTQLFEGIFLFLLFGVLVFLLLKKNNRFLPSIYLITYGVWRFGIEYLRDDPRGTSGIPFLTPSQLSSVFLVIFGIALIFFYIYLYPKLLKKLIKEKPVEQAEGDSIPVERAESDAAPVERTEDDSVPVKTADERTERGERKNPPEETAGQEDEHDAQE